MLTTLTTPLPGCARDTLLSPCSMESVAFRFLADMAHINSERLESPCPSSAGVSPANAPLLALRQKQDAGELAAQAQSPKVWGPPPPSAALRKRCHSPTLSSPHQVTLTHGWCPAFLYVGLAPRLTVAAVTSAPLACARPQCGQGRPRPPATHCETAPASQGWV